MSEYLLSFLGGILLGLSAVGYLFLHGRIAGISGLLSQMFQPQTFFKSSAFWFLLGLISIPLLYNLWQQPHIELSASPILMIIAGILVGFGTRLGSGCTSGHGICGISRLSTRSLVATMSFMFAGFITVYIVRHMLGLN